jgi:hypothetical protein
MVLAMVPAVVPAMVPALVPAEAAHQEAAALVPAKAAHQETAALVPEAVAMVALGLCLRSVIWIPIILNAFLRTSLTHHTLQKTFCLQLLSAKSPMTVALRRFLKKISMP